MSYNPTAEEEPTLRRCRWFGHKWRFDEGFHTIGYMSKQHCAREGCQATREVLFWIDRSVL